MIISAGRILGKILQDGGGIQGGRKMRVGRMKGWRLGWGGLRKAGPGVLDLGGVTVGVGVG